MLSIKDANNAKSESAREYAKLHHLLQNDDKTEAIKAIEEFISKHTDYAPAYNNLATMYSEIGDNDKSLQYYEKAYALDPYDPIIQKNLADFYFAVACRPFDAMELYLKTLRANPEDVDTLLIIGNICALIENFEDAKFFYNKVLDIEPWNITAMDNLDTIEEIQKLVALKKDIK